MGRQAAALITRPPATPSWSPPGRPLTARDEARPDSDLDLIAGFDRPVGYLGLARVQHALELLLGCRVDLVTPGMIRPEHRNRILGEAVRAT